MLITFTLGRVTSSDHVTARRDAIGCSSEVYYANDVPSLCKFSALLQVFENVLIFFHCRFISVYFMWLSRAKDAQIRVDDLVRYYVTLR